MVLFLFHSLLITAGLAFIMAPLKAAKAMRLVPTISPRLIRMSGLAFSLHAVIRETAVRLDWRHSRPSLWFVGQISGVLVIVIFTALVAAHREESRNS